ncbi:MAG: HD domain-containing protein [bacterium]
MLSSFNLGKEFIEEIKQYKDCLANLAAKPEDAYRIGQLEGQSDHILMDLVDPWDYDVSAILGSKAFRRLSSKTQVQFNPANPHIRTRLSHTCEVLSYSVTLAGYLGLNRPLTSAIAHGHDIGHTPCGHFGERQLSELSGKEFEHAVFGVVIAREIERRGGGLKLTGQTLQGIRYHSSGKGAIVLNDQLTQEGRSVQIMDGVCYSCSDDNDANRNGISVAKIAPWINDVFGTTQRQRMQTLMLAIIEESAIEGKISFTKSPMAQKFAEFKALMYKHVYLPRDWSFAGEAMKRIYDQLPDLFPKCDPAILIALMTDNEFFKLASALMATSTLKMDDFRDFGILEIYPHIIGKEIDFSDPGLLSA